eukprot:1433972-Pyramimonas_sp.AAC.1
MTAMISFADLLDHREICECPRLRLRRRRARRRRAGARLNNMSGVHQATGAQEEIGNGRTLGIQETVGEDDDEYDRIRHDTVGAESCYFVEWMHQAGNVELLRPFATGHPPSI